LTSGFALAVGLLVAWLTGLGVLALIQAGSVNRLVDVVITGLFLSGGTDGVNSLLKLLGYSKEKQKGDESAEPEQMKKMHV
jgi:hypothetical protein